MSTITREWLQQAINDYESVRDELPFGLDDYQGNILAALRIALASLEAEPVSQTYKSQHTQFEQVADLYEMQFDDGRTCAFHTDAQKAAQWLQACDGNRVQEYVKLERLRNALSGNSPVIPSEVLSAIQKVARVRADFDDFDGDRRGIGDCLDEAEQELIVTINKYASQLAAGPIAPNDVREQTAVPPVPVIQADVAQAIEKLKRKLVECNRYNYCADAVKGVEYACHAAMLQGSQPVSQTYKLNQLSGNSPVTPDGWISCSERMPAQDDWILIYSKHGEYMAGQVQGEYVELSDGTLSWLGNALYWMPLPEPPQEAK